jgi:hypothetical protein
MDRDQLIDLTRRARKLARDKTTDLAPSEYSVRADSYTSAERLAGDTAMLIASPQLVGYSSELPRAGTYCTAGAAAVFDYAHARPRWLAAQLFQAWAGHGPSRRCT